MSYQQKHLSDNLAPKSHSDIITPDKFDFERSELSEQDRLHIIRLFNRSQLLPHTLNSFFPVSFQKEDIAGVEIEKTGDKSKYRNVYRVTVRLRTEDTPYSFALKMTKKFKSDYYAVLHEVTTVILNDLTGEPKGFFGAIPANHDPEQVRFVLTEPFFDPSEWISFNILKEDRKAQAAVIRESVRIWKKPGGFFIFDAYKNQFVLRRTPEGDYEAHLIDKGLVHPRGDILDMGIYDIKADPESGEPVSIPSAKMNLYDLRNWAMAFDEDALIYNLIINAGLSPEQLGEDGFMAEGGQDIYRYETESLVLGVIGALGPVEARVFF
ncbi:MAG: hypothetical protein JW774_11630 [Candidatus Aureabacteria bacterium]|nr:hypothetical protein [Candidatus Auribacterota bacterium]